MSRLRTLALIAISAMAPHLVAAQSGRARPANDDTTTAEIVARAEHAYATERWSDAADLYEWVVAAEDGAPEQWWPLAHALFNARRHRESIAAFERALQLGVGEPRSGAFQIARAYAHRGNRKQALRWLARAVDLGFDGREAIRREPMFEQYRDDPRFSAISDPSGAGGTSPRRLPAGRTRRAPIRKVEPAHLAAAHSLDSGEETVGAGAAVDDALREIVREILEAHLVAERS
jgi:tetratricopeptide (TPR) repeat protein